MGINPVYIICVLKSSKANLWLVFVISLWSFVLF